MVPKLPTLASVKEKLAKLGAEEESLSVDQFQKFVSDDMAATLKLAKDAHLQPTD